MKRRLFRKYAALIVGIVSVALIANGLLELVFTYREQTSLLLRMQHDQARAAADKIGQFARDVEDQISGSFHLSIVRPSDEDRRLEALRLLRRVPAITELVLLDHTGRETVKVSRVSPDVLGSGIDRSAEQAFDQASASKAYYGPVYFRYGSEPYVTLGIAGARPETGVVVAEVNLRFVWDVVTAFEARQGSRVYVTDDRGVLIAHPDISLVLGFTNVGHLPHVQAARNLPAGEISQMSTDLAGLPVLSAGARVPGINWQVFVESPIALAYKPVYASLKRSAALLALALGLAAAAALILARRISVPIETLSTAAAKFGKGDLSQRVVIATGDELQSLSENWNQMATQLQESYATLEGRVRSRTRELEQANQAKTRFLAVASHDLRQPLHALGLFVGQLKRPDTEQNKEAFEKIDASLLAMNRLFDGLLDISKLDAGAVTPDLQSVSINHVFDRLNETLSSQAFDKGLSWRIVETSHWVHSDPVLLQRVITNLASNAVRHTHHGVVLIGCRRRGDIVRIEVHDTGEGIPDDEKDNIFREFVRLKPAKASDDQGLGLGLTIVERLCKVLGHTLDVQSRVGRGSCFAVGAQLGTASASLPKLGSVVDVGFQDRLIAVIDDDALVLDAMRGLLETWGCHTVTLSTSAAILQLSPKTAPDLIISDYSLEDGTTGIDAITRMRAHYETRIPAILISGDSSGAAADAASEHGFLLLRKPIAPMQLRAALIRTLLGK